MESWLLENPELLLTGKYINDAFWTGRCRGADAIEKRSTKAPWSIGNEYRMAVRLHAVAPEVVAEPLVWRSLDDGSAASVATARVRGPSLSDLLARGVANEEADGFAADLLAFAKALQATGILHRDVYTDNFLLGEDGHLKAIDFQMAIDRNDYREDPWVAAHPKFLYVVFGVNHNTPPGCWDDRAALDAVLALLPQTDKVAETRRELAAIDGLSFTATPSLRVRIALRLYALSLAVQSRLPWRSRKRREQARRRMLTILGRGGVDVDGRDPDADHTGKERS